MSAPSIRRKVVVSRDLGPDAMSLLRGKDGIDLIVWPEDRACERAWLIENVEGASGIIVTLSDTVTPELLEKAGSNLRVISTMSVGYEHINLTAMSDRGVRLGYTPDVLTEAVADLTVMLALMAGRNAGQTMSVVSNGEWPIVGWSPFGFCGPQLSTSIASPTRTVGFIGFGRISQATLRRLVPFGITHCVYYSNPASPPQLTRDAEIQQNYRLKSVKRVDLQTLATESDVVFVLTPGGNTTMHMVNAEFLRKMKRTAVLINTSRGTVVDSDALVTALREGWIWGAGLDVVEGEPKVTADHPLVREPRCVVLPHIGSATLETRTEMATLAAKNLLAGIYGEAMPAELELKG